MKVWVIYKTKNDEELFCEGILRLDEVRPDQRRSRDFEKEDPGGDWKKDL